MLRKIKNIPGCIKKQDKSCIPGLVLFMFSGALLAAGMTFSYDG